MYSTLGVSDASVIDSFFSSTTNSQSQLDSQANNALSRGIDQFTQKDYVGAAREFKRSILLSPSSDNSSKAYDYLAQAYLNQGKTSEAIKTYQQAIKSFPSDDTFRLSLGDTYYKNGRTKEALTEYFKAVQVNPSSADNRYSLGQIYLTSGRLSEAREQFIKVSQLAPTSPTGFYGLGQVSRASGDYSDALIYLNKAVAMKKTFANAILELGYTYMDMGEAALAQEQIDSLQGLGASSQVTALQNYMAQTAGPKIIMAYSPDNFDTYSGPGTLVSSLDSTLSSAKATKAFTMAFLFSKDMDSYSVESLANWQIGRQSGTLISDDYNFGMPNPSTEVSLPAQPTSVVYDSSSKMATVTFSISQNSSANGTIDPSHISFKFIGKDTYKKTMDPIADEYSGFSKII